MADQITSFWGVLIAFRAGDLHHWLRSFICVLCSFSIGWDGHDDDGVSVASGVYFYRLEMDSFTDIKKLMLVK
jgi:hypothetical protein